MMINNLVRMRLAIETFENDPPLVVEGLLAKPIHFSYCGEI
jgi:hypothetical protein